MFEYKRGVDITYPNVNAAIADSILVPLERVYIPQVYTDSVVDIAVHLIREVQADEIAVDIHYCRPVIDAILSRPNQRFILSIHGIDRTNGTRIIQRLTNIYSLTFHGADFPPILGPLPPSLGILSIAVGQAYRAFVDHLSTLVNMEELTITGRYYSHPVVYAGFTSSMADVIKMMPRLRRLIITLAANEDPLPLLLALPPSIEYVQIERRTNYDGTIVNRLVIESLHTFPNLKSIWIGLARLDISL